MRILSRKRQKEQARIKNLSTRKIVIRLFSSYATLSLIPRKIGFPSTIIHAYFVRPFVNDSKHCS